MNISGADNGSEHNDANSVALARSGEVTLERMQQIWARRAAQLAQVPVQEDEGEQVELVLIQLGHERYGLDARFVFGIRPIEQITRVPRVPDWVAGVVNMRGRILSVVDLRQFFGLPAAEPSEGELGETTKALSHLIVVETPEIEVALLADGVLAVETVSASRIQDTTNTVRGLRPEYVRGVVEFKGGEPTTNGKTLVVVLDLPALLADERLIVREEIV